MSPYLWECHLIFLIEILDFVSCVFHIFRSKVYDLCELQNIYVHIEFNGRRGILPGFLGLNSLRSKGKANRTNLYEIIVLKERETTTSDRCSFMFDDTIPHSLVILISGFLWFLIFPNFLNAEYWWSLLLWSLRHDWHRRVLGGILMYPYSFTLVHFIVSRWWVSGH